MSDIPIPWKKITRGLPKVKRYADDRAPTFDEIKKICDYPDRRMRSIICTMSSSGIRLGAWDYLQWRHIIPIEYDGKIIAAKIVVYAGTEDEYYSFTTPEAYYELEKWINFRKDAGEMIDEASWLMVQLWNTKSACIPSHKIKSVGIKQLVTRSLKTCGVRNKKRKQSDNGYGTRYEFQTNHGFRKWFKTRCELAGKAERKNFTPLLVDVNAKSSTIPDDIEGGYFSSAGNSQFQLTGKGTDYPPECYYCNQAFNGIDKKAYEKHVLVNHPKMQCYPGPADIEFYKLTPKGMDWEK